MFTPRLLYPQERTPVPWVDPQSRSGSFGDGKKSPVLGIEPRFLDRPFRSRLNQIHYTECPKILYLCDFIVNLYRLKAEMTRNRNKESPGKDGA